MMSCSAMCVAGSDRRSFTYKSRAGGGGIRPLALKGSVFKGDLTGLSFNW